MTALANPPAVGIDAVLDQLDTDLDQLLAAVAHTPDPGGTVVRVDRLRRRLEAIRLRFLAVADAQQVASAAGLPTTASWMARETRTPRQSAAREVALATALGRHQPGRPGMSATRDAFEHGDLSTDHARVIAHALDRLPDGTTLEQRATCEARLVTDARQYDPDQLRRLARRVLAEVEPDERVVDAHEDAQLVSEEDAAYSRAALTFHDHGDGTVTGRFTLPRLQADILRKVVEAMTAPRRTRQERQGEGLHDPSRERGQAFAALLEHLPVDHLHGRTATQVIVTMDIAVLTGTLKAAGIDTDHPLSAAEARRLACGSPLVPAVVGKALGGRSRVLDLGRSSRLFTDAQRTALAATHTGCVARGCTRPFAWCELHHRTAWARGGQTDLDEAVPLCHWHHRTIHDHRYEVTHHLDRTVSMRLRT